MLEAVRVAAVRRQHSGLVEQSDPLSVDPLQFHELLCDPLCVLTLDFHNWAGARRRSAQRFFSRVRCHAVDPRRDRVLNLVVCPVLSRVLGRSVFARRRRWSGRLPRFHALLGNLRLRTVPSPVAWPLGSATDGLRRCRRNEMATQRSPLPRHTTGHKRSRRPCTDHSTARRRTRDS